MSTKLIYGNDHRGVQLKRLLLAHAKAGKRPFQDVGINKGSLLDYVDISKQMAEEIYFQPNSMGISICRRGFGVAMALNRFSHIRACVCSTLQDVIFARQKLNTNVLCLGSDVVTPEAACEMVEAFVSTPFSEGKHLHCVDKISKKNQIVSFECYPQPYLRVILQLGDCVLLCRREARAGSEEAQKYFLPGMEPFSKKSCFEILTHWLSYELHLDQFQLTFAGVFECMTNDDGNVYRELGQIFNVKISELPKKSSQFFSQQGLRATWRNIEEIPNSLFTSEKLKQFIHDICSGRSVGVRFESDISEIQSGI